MLKLFLILILFCATVGTLLGSQEFSFVGTLLFACTALATIEVAYVITLVVLAHFPH